MNYKYDENNECFVRVDNKGRRLNITRKEAKTICKLVMKGYTREYIYKELGLRIKPFTLKTFIKNFKAGNVLGFNPKDYEMSVFDKLKMKLRLR